MDQANTLREMMKDWGSSQLEGRAMTGAAPVIAFSSASEGAGRTTLAMAFSRYLSEAGLSVLMVDGNIDWPGMTQSLLGGIPEHSAIRELTDGLNVLPVSREILNSQEPMR